MGVWGVTVPSLLRDSSGGFYGYYDSFYFLLILFFFFSYSSYFLREGVGLGMYVSAKGTHQAASMATETFLISPNILFCFLIHLILLLML